MMTDKFKDIGVKNYGTSEIPLFKANDIANLLGIKNIRETIKDFNEKEKVSSSTDTVKKILIKTTKSYIIL
jgi:prophage antirepressor-like protein